MQLERFGGQSRGNPRDAAVEQWHHAREQRLSIDQKTFADRMILIGEEQGALAVFPQLSEQGAAELGDCVDAGQGRIGVLQCLDPRLEVRRIGQRREQQLFVLALVLLVTQRERRSQARTEKMLAQLARDQRLAVGALQEGDGLQFMAFLGDIGQYLDCLLYTSRCV